MTTPDLVGACKKQSFCTPFLDASGMEIPEADTIIENEMSSRLRHARLTFSVSK